MGKIQRTTTAERRQGRRWRFASAVFDEATWSLTVDGRPAPIEGKPLELLHELLLHAGELVSKDELLEAVWRNVSVVEASLPTAVLKLRRALQDDGGGPAIIETAPRIGYRLAAAVEVEFTAPRSDAWGEPQLEGVSGRGAPGPTRLGRATARVHRRVLEASRPLGWVLAVAGFTLTLALGATLAALTKLEPAKATPFNQQDAKNAIRRLDVAKIEELLRAGWNPNTPFDTEGNGAVNILLGVCEWDRGHDRKKLVLMAKTLFDGGARLDSHNVWGDTAYSIAKAPRYCGPDHPVTQMIRAECYSGFRPLGDRCLEDYRRTSKAD
jgi:DNA-binding winged helix-turn-helix (wHTH) protein